MFARHMLLQLKPTLVNAFQATFEKEILPLFVGKRASWVKKFETQYSTFHKVAFPADV